MYVGKFGPRYGEHFRGSIEFHRAGTQRDHRPV